MTSRPHAAALAMPLVVLLSVLAGAGFAAGRLEPGPWQAQGRVAVAAVAAAAVLRWSVVPWLRWLGTVLVVSDRRVTVEWGVLRRARRSVPLSRVVDVGLHRSVPERLLGSGTLVLDAGAEHGVLVVRRVPRARAVQREVERLLDRTDA